MKRKTLFLGFTLLMLIGLLSNSCKSNRNREIDPEFGQFIAAFTSGSVHNASNIEIQFTQEVANVEEGATADAKLFDFSPSIKGEAYWKDNYTIVYVPEKGQLKPDTEYDATFNLGKIMKVDSKFEEFYFNFKVPEQTFILSLDPYSPITDENLAWNRVSGVLRLSNEAEIEDIQNMFSLSDKKGASRVKVYATPEVGTYNVTIDSLFRSETETIAYSLKVDGSKIKSKKQEDFTISLPSMPEFDILNAEIIYEPQECIRITFSDPISSKQDIKGLIKVNKLTNFAYELDRNIVRIYVDSKAGEAVTINIYKELKNSMNKPLGKERRYDLTFERHEPQIKLAQRSSILANTDQPIITFQAVNLWAVDVNIIKVYENNVLYYLQQNDFGEGGNLKSFGKLVKKEHIRLDKDPSVRLDRWNTFSLDLSSLIKKDPGAIYKLEFRMQQEYSTYSCSDKGAPTLKDRNSYVFDSKLSEKEEEYWNNPNYYYYSDYDWEVYNWEDVDNPCTPSYYMNRNNSNNYTFVQASNIGITAKQGASKSIFVALTNIKSTEPLADSKVSLYDYQMQLIGSGTTDSEGFAMINYKGIPFVVVAEKDNDKGYLKIAQNLSLSLSNFDVSGKQLEKGLKGYIYGERGVWRPGDSIFVTFILEDRELTIPQEHPATLELYTPKGQLYKSYVSSSHNGFYPFRMATTEDANTGNWLAKVKIGGTYFSQNLRVETVKPNRLKIRLETPEVIDASRSTFASSISSQWLHGAPAANLKAKVEMSLTPASVPFEGYPGYVFNNPASTFSSEDYDLYDGTLNANGEANFTASLPDAKNAPGMLRARFISRVFENGGDASVYMQVAPYSPFSSYVGLKTPKPNRGRWLETDATYPLEIVTAQANGKPIDVKQLNVKIYKISWSWWWNSGSENFASYINNSSAEVVFNRDFGTQAGKAKVDFKIEHPNWGRYLVLVTNKESGHVTGEVIYVDWPSYMGRANKKDSEGLTMLSFSTDKEKYEVGEIATVILPKSSDGRALISLEDGSRILSKNWVKTSATEDTKYTFKVTEEMAPNFYIFASLYQPIDQVENSLPVRMYGVLNINVENKETVLQPIINMPEELRPEQAYTISITERNKKDMTYTLAVVDEGLLDLTAFKTPNAWSDFYARQALGVRTWDMFDFVLGTKAGKMGPLLNIGGDEALKPSNETMKRFKPVVKYIGPFTLAGGKTNTHKLTMPPYYGSVRVMVVAGNNKKSAYGNAQKAVPVRNPLMVISTLPRVAGPGEEIMLPVNIFALDKKVKDVSVKVKSNNGLFSFVDGSQQSVSFSGTGDKTIYFKVKVANNIGFEKVEIVANANGETSSETIDIEVRNPNPPIILSHGELVDAGKTANLNLSLETISSKDWVKLEVTRMPGLDLNRSLKYLFEYPHGCSEQVTSKAFPALFLGNFKTLSEAEKTVLQKNIRGGINTIVSRQLSNGGIAYWPGDRYPNEWVTTYATHFLVEADRAGYNIPGRAKERAIDILKKSAQEWNGKPLYSSYYASSMSSLQQAYRLYVLALANSPELGAMNRLKENTSLSEQARWRLAAAYAISGRKDAAREIIAKANGNIAEYGFSNDTYGSYSRDLAMVIETKVLMDDVKGALIMAQKLASQVNESSYLTTQTSAYSLLALSKLAQKVGNAPLDYEWELNGSKQKHEASSKVYQEIEIKPTNKVNVQIKNAGGGIIYTRLIAMTQPLVDKSEGISQGVSINVSYENQNGGTIDVSRLTQGTEFYAVVNVRNLTGQFLSDLTLTQIFASGWEIFNNRLLEGGDNNSSSYNYQDIRDDRVYTYFNLSSGSNKTFKVRLQAAYQGKFYLPATVCEAMYSPDIQGRTTGQWVEINK